MDDNVWRPAHLTPEQMEERRLAGATLLRQGRLSQAEIARQLGVSRASVCRWAATLAQEGPRGLEARPIPGQLPRLDEKAWARLGRLLDRGAMAAGFATERWTLKRIAAVIEREFGVQLSPALSGAAAQGAWLQRAASGHTGQGARRARDRGLAQAGMGGAQKKAQREHRTLLLWDETGHSFRARPGTTWARRGLTPVLRRVSKRREVSSIVAITPDGRLYARHFRTSISSRCVILALRYCPSQDRHAPAGGLGPAQRPSLTGNNGLRRGASAGLCGGLPAGLCARAQSGGAMQCPRQARHGQCAPWISRRSAPPGPPRILSLASANLR